MSLEALCQACGLCCDGSLFSRVPLGVEERVPEVALAVVTNERGGRHVPQRCAALAGTELGVDVGAVCTRFGVPVTAAPTVMPAANENAGDQAKPNLSLVREAA